MNEEVTNSTNFFVQQGAAACFGMIGAAILYLVMPPIDKKGQFNRKEFASRLAVAGLFSIFFGDMLASALNHFVPWLDPWHNKSAVDLLAGAPGWWISRAIALWFHQRQNKNIAEIIKEVDEKKESDWL